MSKIVSQIEFIRRFAKEAGIMQKDARHYLSLMLDEITRALASSREVRLSGIGNLKRVRFPSKTMPNPNDRSQQLLVLDRYYMRIKPSHQLKLKLKANLFPDKFSMPEPKYRIPKAPAGSQKIGIGRSFKVPINIRPTIPQVSWRRPISSLVLDLRAQNPQTGTRLLRNIMRQAADKNTRAITIAPYDVTFYGDIPERQDIKPTLYHLAINEMMQQLPNAFLRPQTWRLLVNLPKINDSDKPRQMFNFSALPSGDNDWAIFISSPRFLHAQPQIVGARLPEHTKNQVDTILNSGRGRVAIIGSHAGRRATIDAIRQYMQNQNITHHYTVEHHHHALHPHHILGPSLRSLHGEIGTYPVTVIDELSQADNFYHLRQLPGITISNITSPDKKNFDRILGLQKIPPDYFDTIIESYTLPAACNVCAPATEPAVRFPLMRRLAGARGQLLHVHPVRVHVPCKHDKSYHLVNITHSKGKQIGPSLDEQLYHMALNHDITYNTVEEMIK